LGCSRTARDWRGLETTLRAQRHVIRDAERVLVVDDWGASTSVDQLPDDVREQLQPVARVALAAELRPA